MSEWIELLILRRKRRGKVSHRACSMDEDYLVKFEVG